MPLDKSRIQGIGSDGTVTTSATKITHCPAGHCLKRWTARQGWCDGCGKRISTGEQVMDCRICNWYLCNDCRPLDPDESSLWGQISSMADQVGGPGLTSALDSFSLQVGDIWQATTEEVNEIGNDIASFVNSAIGMDDSDEEAGSAPARQKPVETSTPAQRKEAASAFSSFCENYPAYRVVPKPDEIEAFLSKCGKMSSQAISAAMYDQLSFSSGELDWQPRLRCLHVLEFCYSKGGGWRNVSSSVAQQGEGLIKHLTDVQQCRKEAIKVYITLLGKEAAQAAGLPVPTKAEEEAAAAELAKSKTVAQPAPAKPKATPDLLDFASASAEPKANVPVKTQAKAAEAAGGPADLLDTFEAQSAPPVSNLVPDLDLLNPAAFAPATSSSAPATDAAVCFSGASVSADPSLLTALGTVAPGTVGASTSTAAPLGPAASPQDLIAAAFNRSVGASSSSAGVISGGAAAVPNALVASTPAAVSQHGPSPSGLPALHQASPYPFMGPSAPAPNPAAGLGSLNGLATQGWGGGAAPAPGQATLPPTLPAPPVFGGSLGRPGGVGYDLPKVSELTPLSTEKDPFDFVMQHTGLGATKSAECGAQSLVS